MNPINQKIRTLRIFLVTVMVGILLTGCGKRAYTEDEFLPVTGDEFCRIANSQGLYVGNQSNSDQVKKLDNVDEYYTITGTDYKIEFIIFEDVKAAQNNFSSCTQGIDKTKGDYTYGKNYDIYAFKEDTPYYYVLRVENTLYFCSSDPESIDTVTDLLTLLGY